MSDRRGGRRGQNYNNSSDDEMEGPKTRSTRRGVMRVDLSKLDIQSLVRYRKVHKLGDAPPTATKEELMPSVSRHFAQQVVDEEEVLLKFVLAVQKHNKQQWQMQALQQQRLQEQRLLLQQQQQQQAAQYRLLLQQQQQQQHLMPNHLKGGIVKTQRR